MFWKSLRTQPLRRRRSPRAPRAMIEQLESRVLLSVAAAPNPTISFAGPGYGGGLNAVAADCTLGVGTGVAVAAVNENLYLYQKTTGALEAGPVSNRTFFGLSLAPSLTDPVVAYDSGRGRFVCIWIDEGQPSSVLIAISKTGQPSTLTSNDWWTSSIDTTPYEYSNGFFDYPRLAITQDNLILVGDKVGSPAQQMFIVPKDPLYSGGAPTDTFLTLPALANPYSYWLPAQPYSPLPAGVTDYLLTTDFQPFAVVVTPNQAGGYSLINQSVLPEAPLSFGGQSDQDLHETGLSTNISGEVPTSGCRSAVFRNGFIYGATTFYPGNQLLSNGQPNPDFGEITGLWYKYKTTDANGNGLPPSSWSGPADWGIEGGEDIAPGTRVSLPALAVNSAGDIGLSFVATGPNIYAGEYFAVHRNGDPAHTLSPSVPLQARGVQGQFLDGQPFSRWGDYETTTVDPSDDSTFWVFGQYAPLNNPNPDDWETTIASFAAGTREVVMGDDGGTVTNDAITIRMDAPGSSLVDILVNGTMQYQGQLAATSAIDVRGLAGNNALTIDCSNGASFPSGGITYDGGTGSNALSLIGTAGNDTVSANGTSLQFGSAIIDYAPYDVPSIIYATGGGADSLNVNGATPLYLPPGANGAGIHAINFSSISIGDGAVVVAQSADQHSDRSVLVLGSLQIASAAGVASGTLDVRDNDVDIQNGGMAMQSQVEAWIASAYDSGKWDRPGLTSTVCAVNSGTTYALGYGEVAGFYQPVTSFDGLSIGSTDVLVKYTWVGDANLNGAVNNADYYPLNQNYNHSGTAWATGDFNYSGNTDQTDYNLLLGNYGKTGM